MSFFLLGKGSDDDLWLLSPKPVASRQEAMAELSRLTADPGFEHWDAEVLVMELDKGTPVLLVRPAAMATPEPATAPAVEAESPEAAAETVGNEPTQAESQLEATVDEEMELPAGEPELVGEQAESEAAADDSLDTDPALAAVIEDLHTDEDADAAQSVAAEDAMVTEADEAVPGAALVGEGTAAVELDGDGDAVVVEADEVPVVEAVDPVWAEAVVEELAEADTEDGSSSLKDALKRTAAKMESEGIIAPESVGPAEETAPPVEPTPTDVISIPAESSVPEAGPVDVPLEVEEAAAWPWDTAAAESGFTLDAIEEPAREATPLVTAAGDDETLAVSRPVILGSYGESTGVTEASPLDSAIVAASETEQADETLNAPDTSDFILDLEPTPPATPVAVETAAEPSTEPLAAASPDDMTCEDCVYVRTCPNTGQRDPRTCGSFQWK